MRFRSLMFAVLICGTAFAADKKIPSSIVDSGSFGILVAGKRVATESFRMEQMDGMNVVTAELRADANGSAAVQKTEMEIAASGNLKRYSWKETSPGKAQLTVQPDDAFLVVEARDGEKGSPQSTSHPLTPFTAIVDDNFFSHLQVLAWKYMAMGCKPDTTGKVQCQFVEKKLPILNPHQGQALLITLNYLGLQKMKLKGAEQEYHAFKFSTEAGDWTLWMDDQNKMVRVLIAAENTEVLRD